jgi:hypothetical protein
MPLKVLVSVLISMVFAASASAQTLSEHATCKFTNTAASKTLYEGPCKVTQSESGRNTIFSVKMGDAEPYMFAGVRGQKNWMHGPDAVQFTDAAGGGIFRWSTFALVVAEGGAHSAASGGGDASKQYNRGCADAKAGSCDRAHHDADYEKGWQACKTQPQAAAAAGAPSKQEQACLAAVSNETDNGEVTVLSSEFSQANSIVMTGVGSQRAPWRCLVSNSGVVQEGMFAGSDGGN